MAFTTTYLWLCRTNQGYRSVQGLHRPAPEVPLLFQRPNGECRGTHTNILLGFAENFGDGWCILAIVGMCASTFVCTLDRQINI